VLKIKATQIREIKEIYTDFYKLFAISKGIPPFLYALIFLKWFKKKDVFKEYTTIIKVLSFY